MSSKCVDTSRFWQPGAWAKPLTVNSKPILPLALCITDRILDATGRALDPALDLFSLSVGLKLCVTDYLVDGNFGLALSDLCRPDDAILVHKVVLGLGN